MTAVDPYAPLTCPMPDCDESLYLTWSTAQGLTGGDLVEGEKPPVVSDAHSTTWKVECIDGHVVLLPGPAGCPCEDQGGPDCQHSDSPASDDFDWSEDSRTFRPHDVDRLKSLLGA